MTVVPRDAIFFSFNEWSSSNGNVDADADADDADDVPVTCPTSYERSFWRLESNWRSLRTRIKFGTKKNNFSTKTEFSLNREKSKLSNLTTPDYCFYHLALASKSVSIRDICCHSFDPLSQVSLSPWQQFSFWCYDGPKFSGSKKHKVHRAAPGFKIFVTLLFFPSNSEPELLEKGFKVFSFHSQVKHFKLMAKTLQREVNKAVFWTEHTKPRKHKYEWTEHSKARSYFRANFFSCTADADRSASERSKVCARAQAGPLTLLACSRNLWPNNFLKSFKPANEAILGLCGP